MKKLSLIIISICLLSNLLFGEDAVSYEDIRMQFEDAGEINTNEWSLIHYIAAFGGKNHIQTAINNGLDINSQDGMGNTPVMISMLFNNIETFTELTENNCDMEIENSKHGKAMFYFSYFDKGNQVEAMKLILKNQFPLDMNNQENMTLAHYSVYGGNVDLLKQILETEADINIRENLSNMSPIDMTDLITYQYTDLVQYSEDDFSRKNEIIKILSESASEAKNELPMSLSIFGDFFFTIYGAIDSLFPYEIDISHVNNSKYFTFSEINGIQTAAMNEAELITLFNDFLYDVEFSVINENIEAELNNSIESPYMYIILFNLGNHPYINQHWVAYRGPMEGFYGEFIKVYNPSRLIEPLYFRLSDISELVTLKITKQE